MLTLGLLGCSDTQSSPGPTEEGQYSDEAPGDEIEGVLIQCGNTLDTNYYWHQQDSGPSKVYVMPVICVGSIDTPGFSVEDAEPQGDGYYGFPSWDEEISAQCEAACLAAHDAMIEQLPVCDLAAFTPNLAAFDWEPELGPNCDSTVLPSIWHGSPLGLNGHSS